MEKLVGIAQMTISTDPADVLIAPNLGSCIAVAVWDSLTKVGGMVHCLLPLSQSDKEKAELNPAMYVDTGTVLLLNKISSKSPNRKNWKIVCVGGANINDQNNYFEIGKKNYTVFRKVMWKNGLLVHEEDVGGSHSRTLSLHVENGTMTLKANGEMRGL